MRRATKVLVVVADGLATVAGVLLGLMLTPVAALLAIPVWIVTVLPLWLLRSVTRRTFRLTLPAFMAYAVQLVTTAISRTILRRFHAGNLEEWPWREPPRRLREGLI